ncbi:MAG: hypothetical protein AAFW84_26860 [Cyanobacteria bacterium J06635_15]
MTIDTTILITTTALLGGLALERLKQSDQAVEHQPEAIPVPVEPRRDR